MKGVVYLIPVSLHSDEQALKSIPPCVSEAINACDGFFAENEKTARRFIRRVNRDFIIDDHFWVPVQKVEKETVKVFEQYLQNGKNIGILSEAGCPGVADPGQILVAKAQEMQARVVPLTGPSSILLALMASGMNGQHFEFVGYLPIEASERKKKIRELEEKSARQNATCIFIETPYRNNALLKDVLATCRPATQLCIAANITSSEESILTKAVAAWRKNIPDLHKKPVIFLLFAGAH